MNMKTFSHHATNILQVTFKLFRYNVKVIFANKFPYFLTAAVVIFLGVTLMNLLSANADPSEATGYWLLLVPGILLVFYPTTFGIQNDIDTRMIEILFGIPNYRYKVWLVRLFLIFLVAVVILTVLAVVLSYILIDIPVTKMIIQLMFPVCFIGSLAFMFSTIIRNGNGTAVVMVLIGMVFWFSQGQISLSEWNLLLNPFGTPENVLQTAWEETIFNNRIYLLVGSVIAMLWGLLNLQKRERFI